MAYSDEVLTAQEVLANESAHQSMNDFEQAQIDAAEAAGVTRSEYVDYEAGLTNYMARDDVEPLDERRARDIGDTVTAAQFRRQGEGSAAVFTSPFDGNVGGLGVDTPGDELDAEGPTG